MPIERLTAEDRLMLWPDAVWPQDIGALAVLDGRKLFTAEGTFRLDSVREVVAGRLHLVPRLRQLVHVPPERLGGPLWVDAPAFDISQHVLVASIPAPGGEAELLEATEQIRRRRLDRARPLWEMWFLTGLAQGRVGMFVRTHHAIADGIAGVATLAAFLDFDETAVAAIPRPWTPQPPPTEAELLAARRGERRAALRKAAGSFAHPLASIRSGMAAWPALRELLLEAQPVTTSVDRIVGPSRALALVRTDFDAVRNVAHGFDVKVNDVLLACVGGGIRRLLTSRSERVDGLVMPVYVPVSLRHGQYEGARGNDIAQMVVPVPIGTADPARRLLLIAAETTLRKARVRPPLGKLPNRGLAGRLMLKLMDRHRVNVTTADLPGSPIPLYMAGARVLEMFPLLPLIARVSLGVGALSYAGRFAVMAVADGDGYPDLDVFASGFIDDFRTLERKLPLSSAA